MPTLQTWWPQDFQTQKRWQTSSSFAMFCPSTGPTIRIVPLRNSWVVSHPSWLLAAMANRFSKRRMAVLMSSKLCQNPVVDPDPTERMPFYIPPLNISTTRIARFCHGFRVLFFGATATETQRRFIWLRHLDWKGTGKRCIHLIWFVWRWRIPQIQSGDLHHS